MAKQIAKLLKATIEDTSDLKQIAKRLAEKGRGGDTMLAHITPKEANILKAAGGAGTVNPDTGLLEFFDENLMQWGGGGDLGSAATAAMTSPVPDYSESSVNPSQSWQDWASSPSAAQFSANEFANFAATSPQYQQAMTSAYAPPAPTIDVRGAQVPQAPVSGSYAPPPTEPGFMDKLKGAITDPETMKKLGLVGLQTIPGILQARAAQKQGQQAKAEMQQLAAPYQQQGRQLIEQAQRGELTAPNQQQIQAMQARINQGVASRGGVGAEQAAAQVEAFRQQLLNNQYNLGLQVSGIGDQIAQGAIKAGLQADQYVNQLTQNYFTNIARTMGGYAPQNMQTQQGGQ